MTNSSEILAIIVNYRSGKLTLRALESLAAERQAHPEFALKAIVVENASGEEAMLEREIATRFADWVTLAVSPVNGGFGAGNNFGLRVAYESGSPPTYFHFLNPDTEVQPGAVGELVQFLEEHPSAGIAGGRFQNEDGSPWPWAFRFPSVLSEFEGKCELGIVSKLLDHAKVPLRMGDLPCLVDWLPGASMLMRREVLERIGGFDEEFFLYYEETDLCLRARQAGFEIWHVPASRVMHICGQSTGVTVQNQAPKRLPRYCYESRRRYFAKNHGYGYAALADLAFLAGKSVGGLKRFLKRQPNVPYEFRDFLRDTVLIPRNRKTLNPARQFMPAGGHE